MKDYEMNQIRNVALLGHIGSGKTTLAESLLTVSGVKHKMGSVEAGNTCSDFDKEERNRHFSIRLSVLPLEFHGHKYNILDVPGYEDFEGEMQSALRVAGGAVLVIDATSGVEHGTIKAWNYLEERKIPRIIFVNKMNKGFINYKKLLNELKDKFGKKIAPFCLPIGEKNEFKGFVNVVDLNGRIFDGEKCVDSAIDKSLLREVNDIRELLLEAVAETDEIMMEKYFEGEPFSINEIHKGLNSGVINGDVVPVLVGSANDMVGVHTLFDMLYDYLPTPCQMNDCIREGHDLEGNTSTRRVEVEEDFSAIIFKTIFDPYMGRISIFKVNSGVLKKDMEVYNGNKDKKEKISNLFLIRGKEQVECDLVHAGDIGATTKLAYSKTGDSLSSIDNPIIYDQIDFNRPCLYYAVETESKNDDEKIGPSLEKLNDEDPTFTFERNHEIKQLLIGGQGEKQIQIIMDKLEKEFGVKAKLIDPKPVYKETIKGHSNVQGKYKKQSGGSGHYGDVFIRFEPSPESFEFNEEVHGGSVPKQYFGAVEKGLVESMERGVLAGFPVMNIKATLYDGSYHSVDSNDLAFKMAASFAFKKGMNEASPVILEPIVRAEIITPDSYMGDIVGDMNKRRGRILGMESINEGYQKLVVEVPQSEMFKYAIDLRSITHSTGTFTMDFIKYEEIPSNLTHKIIKEYGVNHH